MSIKRATQSFTAYVDGVPRVVRVGDLVEDSDPVLRGRTQLFEDVEAHVAQAQPRPGAEAATAAPGEQRALTPPKTADTSKPASSARGGRRGSK
ncbi:hypothetical protein [Streptomyces sp. NPDC003299]